MVAYLPLKQFKRKTRAILQARQQKTKQRRKEKKDMDKQLNHTRTTGAQDHRKSTHGNYNNALQGFCRRLETSRGKYALLTIKRKYEAVSHVKQAYNNRLTIQAGQQK